jgi:hypothetical protein
MEAFALFAMPLTFSVYKWKTIPIKASPSLGGTNKNVTFDFPRPIKL